MKIDKKTLLVFLIMVFAIIISFKFIFPYTSHKFAEDRASESVNPYTDPNVTAERSLDGNTYIMRKNGKVILVMKKKPPPFPNVVSKC